MEMPIGTSWAPARASGRARTATDTPRIRAVRGPVVLWLLLEGSRPLVPLDAVGPQAFQALG